MFTAATAHIGHPVIDNSGPLGYKVKVRRPKISRPSCRNCSTPSALLRRRDLLVEIEAVGK
jgi:hypothetical protein